MPITDEDRAAAEAALVAEPGQAVAARYDAETGRVFVSLANGLDFSFPAQLAEGLAGASAEDLSVIEISPSGTGLHWPALDADLYVPGLLAGVFGPRRWMAEAG